MSMRSRSLDYHKVGQLIVKEWSSRKEWLLTMTLAILFSFLFPLKKEGRRKGERIAKIKIKSHAFLLDLQWPFRSNSHYEKSIFIMSSLLPWGKNIFREDIHENTSAPSWKWNLPLIKKYLHTFLWRSYF